MAAVHHPDFTLIPEELRERPQWVGWRIEKREGKPTKVPVDVHTVERAATDNPATWASFDEAAAALARHKEWAGLGYVFAADDPFVGVDLDKCLQDGKPKPWADQLLALLDSYTEVTPSGQGLHVILCGRLPEGSRNRTRYEDGGVEVYDRLRFFTMTGRHWPGSAAVPLHKQQRLDAFLAHVFPPKEKPAPAPRQASPPDLDDQALWEKMFASRRNGDRIRGLFNGGQLSEYASESEHRMALLCDLAWWTDHDAARMERMYRQTRRNLAKWERLAASEIKRACEKVTDGYSGRKGGESRPAAEQERSITVTEASLVLPTGAELLGKTVARPKWVVEGIMPEGMSVLFGRPKMRKSFLALSTAVAVATGGRALGYFQVERRGVVYLSLEDPEWRLQDRLRQMTKDCPPLDRFFYELQWDRFDKGGGIRLKRFLEVHPEVGFVVIDTFAKVKPRQSTGVSVYDQDYEAGAYFKQIADEAHVGMLALLHTRKAPAEDWIDTLNASTGITGAADTLMLLQANRGESSARLRVTGRDVETEDYHLEWSAALCGWIVEGKSAEFMRTKERQEIYMAWKDLGGAGNLDALIKHLAASGVTKNRDTVKRTVLRMVTDGEAIHFGGGIYGPRTAS